jgi:L-seryl-tRNA(Ser) seleniumtransferase
MEQDEEARARRAEDLVGRLVRRLNSSDVAVERSFPNEAGQPIARASVRFTGSNGAERRAKVTALLGAGNPAIEVGPGEAANLFYVNPMTVDEYEEEALVERLCEVLAECAAK